MFRVWQNDDATNGFCALVPIGEESCVTHKDGAIVVVDGAIVEGHKDYATVRSRVVVRGQTIDHMNPVIDVISLWMPGLNDVTSHVRLKYHGFPQY